MDATLRILMLEDVPADAELVERELRKGEMSFISKRVETREEFVREIVAFMPDVILADYKLPSFDGLSALEIAKEKCPDVPFIFVTGSMGEEWAIETFERGATDYVLKERLTRLVPAVDRALREARERQELRQAEDVLRNQAALLDLAHDAIIVRDRTDRIVFWNNGAETTYGWMKEEALGKITQVLLQTEFPAPIEEINTALLDTGQWGGELSHVTREGQRIVVASRWALQRDGEGAPAGVLEINRDMTEHKRAEEELRQRVEELERFRMATVQREFRMKELKDRVRELEEELKRKPPGTDKQVAGKN